MIMSNLSLNAFSSSLGIDLLTLGITWPLVVYAAPPLLSIPRHRACEVVSGAASKRDTIPKTYYPIGLNGFPFHCA